MFQSEKLKQRAQVLETIVGTISTYVGVRKKVELSRKDKEDLQEIIHNLIPTTYAELDAGAHRNLWSETLNDRIDKIRELVGADGDTDLIESLDWVIERLREDKNGNSLNSSIARVRKGFHVPEAMPDWAFINMLGSMAERYAKIQNRVATMVEQALETNLNNLRDHIDLWKTVERNRIRRQFAEEWKCEVERWMAAVKEGCSPPRSPDSTSSTESSPQSAASHSPHDGAISSGDGPKTITIATEDRWDSMFRSDTTSGAKAPETTKPPS